MHGVHATTVLLLTRHSLHAGGLTIDELKRRTGVSDAQLDTEVIGHDLPILAGCFDDYNDYVDVLGLKHAEYSDVRSVQLQQVQGGHQAAMREVLRNWRTPNPAAATYRALLNAVIRLPGKQRIAEDICKFIVDNVITP